jgi:CheY-like chemotaxis protein
VLFKPFIQLARQNLEVEGTGLGLVISKSLIELMGGHITVNSALGVGTTFKIELPILVAKAEELQVTTIYHPVKSLALNQPQWRLLVVDDNADNRLLLTRMLSNIGFQVREAENGVEAIKVFEQWQPNLIWMDMLMPVMDGYQATTKIRQLKGGDTVKIIAVTASVFQEQYEGIIKAGCDAILHKPVHEAEITAALTKHLHVKFIYQDTIETVLTPIQKATSQMLEELPFALRQQLYQAASNLDIDETDSVLAKIHQLAPETASNLQKLAQCFQFEEIIHLIDNVDKEGKFINAEK